MQVMIPSIDTNYFFVVFWFLNMIFVLSWTQIKQCDRNNQFLHLTTRSSSYNLHQDFVDKNFKYSRVI